MAYEDILYNVAEHVATITLNRPERLNALTPAMRQGLLDAIHASDDDNDVRVLVITGAGRGFCSGGDVKAMQEAIESRTANPLEDKIAPLRDKVLLAMQDCAKPIIAAINGAAAGGGMGLALGCDIRLAASTARMGMTFAARGLHPDWGGTYFLPRIVGTAKACELIWSGKLIDAQEALALDIVSYVTEPEQLLTKTMELAQSFAEGPPIAIRMSKRNIYSGLEKNLREGLAAEAHAQNVCSATKDAKEGILAFNEKREPKFTGQ
jgi:2-(1,2-epoxy-1,2-dihydrophenyl)acetyl-CoA isomerase